MAFLGSVRLCGRSAGGPGSGSGFAGDPVSGVRSGRAQEVADLPYENSCMDQSRSSPLLRTRLPCSATDDPDYSRGGRPQTVFLCVAVWSEDVRTCRWERDQMSRICARVCPSGGRAGPCAVRLGSACC